jgi:hypothetical protein
VVWGSLLAGIALTAGVLNLPGSLTFVGYSLRLAHSCDMDTPTNWLARAPRDLWLAGSLRRLGFSARSVRSETMESRT